MGEQLNLARMDEGSMNFYLPPINMGKMESAVNVSSNPLGSENILNP